MMSPSSRQACTLAAMLATSLPGPAANGTLADADAVGTDQAVEAVWKVQSVDFAYHGYYTVYSCGALRDRVRDILRSVGARDTLTIRTWGCGEMADHARLQITIESPVAATPQNIAAITAYDSKQALVARVRQEQLDSAADIERFAATWRTVSMSRDKKLKLGPSDCELVQQLRRHVFPQLSIRILHDNLHCSAFGNIGQPQLSVAALVAL